MTCAGASPATRCCPCRFTSGVTLLVLADLRLNDGRDDRKLANRPASEQGHAVSLLEIRKVGGEPSSRCDFERNGDPRLRSGD